jgi:hypothetical protein
VPTDRHYGTPAAFRRALTDKLRVLAEHSRWTLPQLQRQIAYDRLLERLYLMDDGWVVKGAVALLARDLAVRETVDVESGPRVVESSVGEAFRYRTTRSAVLVATFWIL